MDRRWKTPTAQHRSRQARRGAHSRGRHDNIEIAPRGFGAFNRSVAHGVDDYYELLDPDVEWIPITALLDGRTYRGPEAVRGWVEDVKRDWRVFKVRWNEVRGLGGGASSPSAFGTASAGAAASR